MSPLLGSIDAPVYVVDRTLLHQIAGFDLHRGAIAAADRRRHPAIDDLVASARRIAVLEGLNDPENLGAVARSARALGVDALVLDPTCIDPYTRRTVRVSMGEILHLPSSRVAPDDWPHRAFELWHTEVPERVAVALGAEGPGLSRHTIDAAHRRVRIPIRDDVDSLNVAAAAAVTFARLSTHPDTHDTRTT
jgi:tRNA G18 (ribose-2'-O)-methylase SpoU